MAKRMTVHELTAMPHYHPTLAEIWTYPAEELARADFDQRQTEITETRHNIEHVLDEAGLKISISVPSVASCQISRAMSS